MAVEPEVDRGCGFVVLQLIVVALIALVSITLVMSILQAL